MREHDRAFGHRVHFAHKFQPSQPAGELGTKILLTFSNISALSLSSEKHPGTRERIEAGQQYGCGFA
jgi:hypothetical protein